MSNKNQKSSNGTQNNSNNAESNNVYRLIEKTDEQLNSTSQKWNERSESGQTITFTKAEQKKASSDAKNADKDGFLPGVFWTGYIVTTDGEKHEFSRLDANGICRTFESVCTWKRATRGTLLDGNASRTAEQREDDATTAIDEAKAKPAQNSVTAMLWRLLESCTWTGETGETMRAETALKKMVIDTMENNDTEAAEKAKSKESKTAQRERELEEAKQAAAAATTATESAIKLLLATGQYKTEEEVRKALGL